MLVRRVIGVETFFELLESNLTVPSLPLAFEANRPLPQSLCGTSKKRQRDLMNRCERMVMACLVAITFTGCRQQAPVADVPQADSKSTVVQSDATASSQPVSRRQKRTAKYLSLLSEYQLFDGELVDHKPADGVIPYDLNSPLFSDYAEKLRFIKLPAGESVAYNAEDTFDFPVGTVIAKTFGHDNDMTDLSKGRRMIETRVLKREKDGWVGLPYVWNDEQTEATLSLTGASVDVQWIHSDGEERKISHLVPNVNDCKRCHVENVPIGPKTRNINGDFAYQHGIENQLSYWSRTGALTDAPNPDDAPRLAVWNDPETGSVDARARAWLEINCAHCHSDTGPARNSGLHLYASVTDPFRLGVFKGPVAAGKGSGGRSFDIVPGKPEDSILMYRLETTHPGEVMPEFGRSVIDTESNELIRQWIAEMKVENQETAAVLGIHKALSSR